MESKKDQAVESKIKLIDEALLDNIAGGFGDSPNVECGPGDCTNHGGCTTPPR
ncbi:hypothetical protein [Stenotrophomonas indicatrix]|uniref:hypothetical protein n=1 Tax=Stenotrophomonas indicatrix TaxID=2045451 RepID=UPI0028A6371B|nr:hypothetical protein [Stenotrophomonas indicatrix]